MKTDMERLNLEELPPRARRIPEAHSQLVHGEGTTSACAENTQFKQTTPPPRWNYLRVRGEYLIESRVTRARQELPPRARRIRIFLARVLFIHGTTSACAENTHYQKPTQNAPGNYLRVRGEYGLARSACG